MFDDLVYLRISGVERTSEEKSASKNKSYNNAYAELENKNLIIYAAKVEGRFIGWISIVYIPKVGPWNRGVLFIDELWVLAYFRRQGIAEELMKRALRCKKEIDAEEIRLYVAEDNIAAQELYEKCGYASKGKAIYMIKK